MSQPHAPWDVKRTFHIEDQAYTYYSLEALEEQFPTVAQLPFSLKVLLEAALRHYDGRAITDEHIHEIIRWVSRTQQRDGATPIENHEIPFIPSRIVLQDFTGVPVVVDLAAMRDTVKALGGDPQKINPLVPVDLVIDHSVMVDAFGTSDALDTNQRIEFERNEERYRFLRWAQTAFDHFRAVPPGTGIVHQVNLEYLASVATTKQIGEETWVFPDSVVGTDSHTTMVNGLGVVGWGVGGIEAEAGMLGQPLYFVMPEVIGFKLTGALHNGATATDLALTVTQMLRKKGVVGKFIEFFGPGLSSIGLADRATVANMAPEYGATIGYFPVDEETIRYLRATARTEEQLTLVETYYVAQGMYRTDETPDPVFTDVIALDLGTVVPSLAGPKRPQDRIALDAMKNTYATLLRAPISQGGFGIDETQCDRTAPYHKADGSAAVLRHGDVVIAAITSCTNTSNPSVMVGAGLLAQKAVARGLTTRPHVKTSLTPGSLVVTAYLRQAGLLAPLEALGFHVAGYGCATCIGNSGPLPDEVAEAIASHDLTVASVLSGNRNFEGRVHPLVKANYLASPPLVVAYALAGTVNIDLTTQPLGTDLHGQPVFLHDIWPSAQEIQETIQQAMDASLYADKYRDVFRANAAWNAIDVPQGDLYQWDDHSTYIQNPPFFHSLTAASATRTTHAPIKEARILALFGDSVTTDHISPAGSIKTDSPAGRYLIAHGVPPEAFNSYGSRRGNHEVMMRGTFANIRIRNAAAPGTEGGVTTYFPTGEVLSIYDAAMRYEATQTPTIVFAGSEYGTGSSRDWAAKGTRLLGIRAVVAQSFERIHRSNLVGMGVLPLQFLAGESWKKWGIDGSETIDFPDIDTALHPGQRLTVVVTATDGLVRSFEVIVRLDSGVEVDYYRNGGILPTVLRQLLQNNNA
jgi:aconitate hydratase